MTVLVGFISNDKHLDYTIILNVFITNLLFNVSQGSGIGLLHVTRNYTVRVYCDTDFGN